MGDPPWFSTLGALASFSRTLSRSSPTPAAAMVYRLIDGTEASQTGMDLRPHVEGLRARQPFSTLYHLVVLFDALVVQLPIRTVLYLLLPRLRPHAQWTLSRSLFVSIFRRYRINAGPMFGRSNALDKSVLPHLGDKERASAIWIQPVNRQTGLQGDLKTYFEAGACVTSRIPAFWYGKNHNGQQGGRRAAKGEKVYLYAHGGGYWEQSAHPRDPITNIMDILLAASSKSTNKAAPRRGLAIEYRLTNETTFPGILADALAAWMHLIREGFQPKDIILTGDSAGGNLSLALARYIRDYRPLYDELKLSHDEPFADSLILFSPWVDVSLSYFDAGPSSSRIKNAATEYITLPAITRARNALVRGLPVPFVSSRWLSSMCTTRAPEEDLFDGFPRALVFGG